jgi:formamidopyrimidine-DNA glycosylase
MPELPEMQALAERLDEALAGQVLARAESLGFTALKTVSPGPEDVEGHVVRHIGRRGKYLVLELDDGNRLLAHLSQGGRVDLERPAKTTRPRGAVLRLVVADGTGVLVREHGTQRKAGWWLVGPGDQGPLERLGPEPDDPAFLELVRHGDDGRRLHTLLRDQRTVAGIGRGYADDILHRARLSPFASLRSLDDDGRDRLLDAVRSVLDEALARERQRTGGLSEGKLGQRFVVHNRAGEPCPTCATTLQRVSYDSHEIAYCPTCQTAGRTLADRRMSRLLR